MHEKPAKAVASLYQSNHTDLEENQTHFDTHASTNEGLCCGYIFQFSNNASVSGGTWSQFLCLLRYRNGSINASTSQTMFRIDVRQKWVDGFV